MSEQDIITFEQIATAIEALRDDVETTTGLIDEAIAQHEADIARLNEAKANLLNAGIEGSAKREKAPQASSKRSEQRSRRLDRVRQSRSDTPKKDSQRDKILALSEDGIAPKDIAKQLKTHVNYVYKVRREALQAA